MSRRETEKSNAIIGQLQVYKLVSFEAETTTTTGCGRDKGNSNKSIEKNNTLCNKAQIVAIKQSVLRKSKLNLIYGTECTTCKSRS